MPNSFLLIGMSLVTVPVYGESGVAVAVTVILSPAFVALVAERV